MILAALIASAFAAALFFVGLDILATRKRTAERWRYVDRVKTRTERAPEDFDYARLLERAEREITGPFDQEATGNIYYNPGQAELTAALGDWSVRVPARLGLSVVKGGDAA